MSFHRSILAFFQGLSLCLLVPSVRRLALFPWLIGVLSYSLALYAAYYFHGSILQYFVSEASGFLASIMYGLTWFAVTLVLLVLALFLSVVGVLISTAAFQTAIVEQVLRYQLGEENIALQEEGGITGIAKESLRAILTESVKLFWLVPLMLSALLLGFIPFLAPLAFLLTSWLLAFQFLDIVLDVAKVPATKRIGFAAKNALSSCAFGMVMTVAFLIPFAGILLAPVATAGAAWLLSERRELWEALPPLSASQ